MNWQTALIFSFIGLTIIGALTLIYRIASGIWNGQPGWLVAGIALVGFVAWIGWNLKL